MKIFPIYILLFISANLFAGGGWPKRKGAYYFKLSTWYLNSNEHFTFNGKGPNVTTQLFNTSLYGEYGITDRLTVIANIPFFYRNTFNKEIVNGVENSPGEELNSFGDTQLGFKYGIFQNDIFSATFGITLDFPFGETGKGLGGRLATGDGEFNHLYRFDVGASVYNSDAFSVYANVYTGLNIRSEGFSEESRSGIEVGAGFINKKVWLVGKLDTIQPLFNGDRTADSNSSGIFVNNFEVITFTPEVSCYVSKNIGVSAGVIIPLDGVFVYTDPSYTAGIFYNLD